MQIFSNPGVHHASRREAAQQPAGGADVDDGTTAMASHMGHDGASHPNDAEEVGIEDRSGLFDRAFFRSSGGDTESGIVHEEIDAPFTPQHFPNDGFDRVVA